MVATHTFLHPPSTLSDPAWGEEGGDTMSGKVRVMMALSVAGMVLLPLFGLLLRFQPSFVHGLRVDAAKAERNCYIAAGCYGGLFLVSAVALCVSTRQEKRRTIERQEAAEEEAIYGKPIGRTKTTKGASTRHSDSRSSSRETAIMLDSPLDDHHAPL